LAVEYFERLKALCLAWPGVFEDYPFGPETTIFKSPKNKIIAMCGEEGEAFRVTVKLTPDESAEALVLPFVRKADYVGRYGWVTARIDSDMEWEIVEPWVRRSYELVTSPAKARRRA
jgi:predicted DNA-binding protein (MmcQ/YjbR family)